MVQFINGKYLINQSQYYKAKKNQNISEDAKFVTISL